MPKRRRRWTKAKRRRARRKAEPTLRRRRKFVKSCLGRKDSRYAGFLPVAEYMKKHLRVAKIVREKLPMRKGIMAIFQVEQEAMSVLGALMLGIVRADKLDKMLPETAIAQALGLEYFPSHDTVLRFYKKANETVLKAADKISDSSVLRETLKLAGKVVSVDADVTGMPSRARKREGVVSGYCNGPIIPCLQMPRVFVEGVPVWSDLREGNDRCVDLFDKALAISKKILRRKGVKEVRERLDSAFGTAKNIRKALKARVKGKRFRFFIGLQSAYASRSFWEYETKNNVGWSKISGTTWIKDIGFARPFGRKTNKVRTIMVRRIDWKKREKNEKEIAYKHYGVIANVRTQEMSAREVFYEYHRRQRAEFGNKDGKQSFQLWKIPCAKLMANRFYAKLANMAQALVTLYFRRFADVADWGPMAQTIRQAAFEISGEKNQGKRNTVGTDISSAKMANPDLQRNS